MKVLIIEDDREIVESISLAFQFYWSEVELLSTHLGEKGAKLVKEQKPDAVILDVGLPDMSGFDVLKKIRKFSEVPVIILTARAYESDVIKALKEKANDYVAKPFRQLELLERVKAQIGIGSGVTE